MTEQDEKQLWMEIEHIFDSGANELRVFNMVKAFIEKRYQALHIAPVISSVCDIHKGTRCENSFPSYTDGKCRECGGQAN